MIISLALVLSAQDATAAAPAAPPAPPPPACTAQSHGAFDFWIGEWEVTPNQEGAAPVANSRIEKVSAGCAIRETWMPFQGPHGASLNGIDSNGTWHQRWVGGRGGIVDFAGGLNADGQMVLTGYWPGAAGPGSNPMIRMTYTLRDDGSVRQHGTQSTDHGVTWGPSFDFIYRRRETSDQ